MARRGFSGMTALRAALGAATGVGQGLQQRELLAEQRRKEAEEAIFRRIQAGLMPVEDVLPQEQGKVGPLEAKPPAPAPMAPATLGQAIAQRTQAPVGGAGLMAPPAFGTPAAMAPAPERPMSRVERVISDFQGRTPRTVRIGDQRYAMQPTQQENMALNIALQQASQQDATAAEDARLAEQARTLAPLIGGDVGRARMLLSGIAANVLGIDATTAQDKLRTEAEIGLIRAQTDAQRAAAALSRAGGKMRRPEEIMDNIANAIAKFSTTRDEISGKLPDMEQVRTFGSTLRSLSGVPIPLEEEFTSPQDRQLIANARAKKYSDAEIRQLLNSKKQP